MVDVYLSLVDEGGVTAPEIASRFGHTPSWLHPFLSRLKDEGAVICSKAGAKGKADLYDAQNPNVLFDAVSGRLEQLKVEALAVVEESWEHRKLAQAMPPDAAVHGSIGIQAAIVDAINSAKRRILVVDPSLSWINPKTLKLLAEKKSQGGDLRVLTDGDSKAQKLQLGVQGIDLKVLDSFQAEFVVCDDRVIVFQTGKASATISTNSGMADLLASQFDGWFGKGKRGAKA